MLRFWLLLLLFPPISLFAQGQAADTARKKCITPLGEVHGSVASATIDKDGGKIISPDGKLELIFPPGALKKKNNITIQAESSTMPSAVGTGYRLEPSGTVFLQPVKVVLHYTEADFKNTATVLLSLALQNSTGQWSSVKDVVIDSTSKTISGYINHFSSLVVYQKAMLIPKSKTLKVNEEFRFAITHFITVQEIDFAEIWELEMRWAFYDVDYFDTKDIPVWRVNGKKGGDAVTGTITQTDNGFGDYKAPAKVPDNNPVTVSVEMEMSYIKTPVKIILLSSVYIIGEGYYVTFRGYSKSREIHSDDQSSFLLTESKEGLQISQVINHPVKHTIPPKAGGAPGCVITLHGLEGWKGPVQIGTVKQTFVRPATKENPYTRYDVMFNNPPTAFTPSYTIACKGTTRTMPAFVMPGTPGVISFELNGDDIRIIWNEKRYGSHYKSPDQNGWFEMSIKKM